MGALVRKIGEDVSPDEPAKFLDRLEALCEAMYEDKENGADCTYTVNIRAVGKKGWIPRSLPNIVNNSHVAIPLLVSEMRRREANPFRATTVDGFLEHFVRWIDSLSFEDFQRVTAFVEEKANNGLRSVDAGKPRLCGVCGLPVKDTPSGTICDAGHGGADVVEEWGVDDEATKARPHLKG